ncbi:Rieske 2Fe-2S domain-containing protein [Paenibacillus chartarius]|uniref:Rieske 2Fe-2S domain-containing protein n=1 Tax=Paenibacillus chartarius TaxID=747481 RepID=A0ABV6DEI7_9BACL
MGIIERQQHNRNHAVNNKIKHRIVPLMFTCTAATVTCILHHITFRYDGTIRFIPDMHPFGGQSRGMSLFDPGK